MTVNSIVIIPARLGSSRFPGKPMALIDGQTMISRVYSNSIKSRLSTTTIVATPDNDIYQHIISIGGRSILTSLIIRELLIDVLKLFYKYRSKILFITIPLSWFKAMNPLCTILR